MKTTKGRGKQVSPTLTHLTVRLPAEVVDYFKNVPQTGSYTVAIRKVLTQYVQEKKMNSDLDFPTQTVKVECTIDPALAQGFFCLYKVQPPCYAPCMALTPEKKVKNKVVKILKERGAYYFFPASYGMGRSGVPDIVACHGGRFLGIECKAGKNTTTMLQDRELAAIEESGGLPLVINEHNLDDLVVKLDTIECKY